MKNKKTFKLGILAAAASAFVLTGCLGSDSSSGSSGVGDATQGSGGKVSQPPSSYQELNEETVSKVVAAYVLGDRALWKAEDWVDDAYDFIDDETFATASGVAASSENGRQSLASWLKSFNKEPSSVQAAYFDDINKSGTFECDNYHDEGGAVTYKITEEYDNNDFETLHAELNFSTCKLDGNSWVDLSGLIFDGDFVSHYSESERDSKRIQSAFYIDYDIGITDEDMTYSLLGRLVGETIYNWDEWEIEKIEMTANIQVGYGPHRVSLTNVKLDELEGTASGVFYHTDLDGRLDVVSEELSNYDELITLKSGEASLKIIMPDYGDFISVEGLGCDGEWSIDEIIEGNHCSG